MRNLLIRGLRAHKLRFAMTTFAVVMGVGFVVGSFVVTDTLRGSISNLFGDITADVDVTVRAESELGAMSTRDRISEDLLEAVREVDGVKAAGGSLGGYAQLLDEQGEPLTTQGAPFIGVAWGSEDELYPATIDDGTKPMEAGQVAIDRATAEDYDFEVGDRTHVLLADGTQPEVEIVGIFTFGETNTLLGARVTAFAEDVAQDVFDAPGQFDSIDVAAEPGVEPAALLERIGAVVPDGVEVVTTQEVVNEGMDAAEGYVDIFRNVLLGFAAVALFVSAFYINNTFSIIVGQRTRELSLLRSLGATPRQITTSVAGEALIVGVVASLIGVGFGMVIATALQAILEAGGLDLPSQAMTITARTWIAAAVVGVGVTFVASTAPARRAATVPPVVGMREGFVATGMSTRVRIWIGVTLTALGSLLVVVAPGAVDGGLAVALVLGAGAMAVFIGVAQLSPIVAIPVAGRVGRPFARLLRMPGRLAQENATRSPDRTAKSASALMIGLALVTTVFIVGASMKESFTRSMEGAVRADFVLSTSGATGFSPALTDAIDGLPAVTDVTGVRFGQILVEGKEKSVVAVDPAGTAAVMNLDLQSGALGNLDVDGILLHEDPAADLGVEVGDRITIEMAAGGARDVRVHGIYADATFAGNYIISDALYDQGFPASDVDIMAFVRVAQGTDLATARAAIEDVMGPFPQVELEDRDEFQASQQAEMDGMLVAINGLLGLALLIALLGIANTLALSVLERTRELGLLRAVGMLRGQVRRMVLTESLLVAVLGAAIGVGVGVLFGLVATSILPASVITTTVVPTGQLAAIVVVSAVCGVVAGLLPARRAGRLKVLDAIAAD